MKNDRLLTAFGQIDDRFIAEADPETNNFERKNNHMKEKKTIPFIRKPRALAAVLALCVCLSGVTAYAAAEGFFEDIFGRNGAVVGTAYRQATGEVALTAAAEGDWLTVELVMAEPDKVPYRELETFGIRSYRIVDAQGQVIAEKTSGEMARVVNGTASVRLSLEAVPAGDYKLMVSELLGGKKADQPLILSGNWECDFTK